MARTGRTVLENRAAKAGRFCLQRVKSPVLSVRLTHTSSHCPCTSAVSALQCCLPSTARTHVSWVTESHHPPALPGLYHVDWHEDIPWGPKLKAAPRKGHLLKRELLQFCHCPMSRLVKHKSLSHNMTHGFLPPSGPLTAFIKTNTHGNKHLWELLRVLQLQLSDILVPGFTLAGDVQSTSSNQCGLCAVF